MMNLYGALTDEAADAVQCYKSTLIALSLSIYVSIILTHTHTHLSLSLYLSLSLSPKHLLLPTHTHTHTHSQTDFVLPSHPLTYIQTQGEGDGSWL